MRGGGGGCIGSVGINLFSFFSFSFWAKYWDSGIFTDFFYFIVLSFYVSLHFVEILGGIFRGMWYGFFPLPLSSILFSGTSTGTCQFPFITPSFLQSYTATLAIYFHQPFHYSPLAP
ncbi:hypothetical protein HOY82DRAFT_552876 [Tuber indicum]|nr:hypothetical protein HOY82DRAFT_566625 [Tuber indicum]KAG0134916.1 hypothetical protein HOY82DRAFT_552876 [Tuber indicum]